MPANLGNPAVGTGLEKVSFHSNPKEEQCQRMFRVLYSYTHFTLGSPGGDLGLIPGSQRSPGRGHGNPLQYSCLENPHGQSSLAGCSPRGWTESDVTERLSSSSIRFCSKSLEPGFSSMWTENFQMTSYTGTRDQIANIR